MCVRFFLVQLFGLVSVQIVSRQRKSVIGHVEQKIATHDPQADQAKITSLVSHNNSLLP